MNLDKMTCKALRELRDQIDAAIEKRTEREKAALRVKFAEMAAEAGVSLSDIAGQRSTKRRAARLSRFRDSKTNVEWSGRGRYPKNFDKARAVEIAA